MVTAAERTHSAPRQAFDPEARGGRAKSAAAAVAAAVADDLEVGAGREGWEGESWVTQVEGLVRVSDTLGMRLTPQMAARLLGLERMRRTHGAEARARREAAAAAKEAARLRAMKWRLGKMLSARDRRQR